MDLLKQGKLLVGLKTKTIRPSIYSLLLESEDKTKKFMHTCIAFTLEEATEDATRALSSEDAHGKDFCLAAKTVRSVESLLEDLEGMKVSKKEQGDRSSVKNLLMQEILASKDLDLLNKYKTLLNKHEKAYLSDRLGIV